MMYGCKLMVSETLCRFFDHPVCTVRLRSIYASYTICSNITICFTHQKFDPDFTKKINKK